MIKNNLKWNEKIFIKKSNLFNLRLLDFECKKNNRRNILKKKNYYFWKFIHIIKFSFFNLKEFIKI
jgi:hypothetical protein